MDEITNIKQAGGQLALLPVSTQAQIDVLADQVIASVTEGQEHALKVLTQCRALERATERITKEIMGAALKEADRHPGTHFEYMGNQFEKAELGTKYDYAASQDPIYKKLKDIFDQAAKQLKDREAFLRTVKEPFTILDEGTGETNVIQVPNKKSTSGLKLTIK